MGFALESVKDTLSRRFDIKDLGNTFWELLLNKMKKRVASGLVNQLTPEISWKNLGCKIASPLALLWMSTQSL